MKPHAGQPVLNAGAPIEKAQAAMLLIHGRGATAESILTLVPEIEQPGFAYFAPQAAGNVWYPYSFLAPISENEPGISSGMFVISQILEEISRAGLPLEKTFILGFSQGACLALEFAARHAKRYGGIIGLSGGLIGPDGTAREYPGSLAETPVFLGCSDADFHIPKARVHEAATVFEKLGAEVTERLYAGMGHTVNQDEIDFVREMCRAVISEDFNSTSD